MAIDLILLEDVKDLGTLGEQVRVADGYARNYLLPRKKAAPLTPANVKRLEFIKMRMQEEYEKRVTVARTMAEKIQNMSVTIPVQAAENDKLYGSVTELQIAQALAQEGIQVERQSIMLAEPIRELGVYNVDIHLHQEVKTVLKVWVVRA